MDKTSIRSNLGIIAAIGAIWGLTEFSFGLGLQKCATLYTGAVLTGLSFFWISFIWSITRKILPVLILVGIVVLFKMLDAVLLPVSWDHGSILNPVWAFLIIALGFILFASMFKKQFSARLLNRVFVGAGAALIAIALFPLAKFTTGTPACLYAATNIPLAIYTAPVAIILSMITVPLGYRASLWYSREFRGESSGRPATILTRIWSPAVVICCLLIITLARIL